MKNLRTKMIEMINQTQVMEAKWCAIAEEFKARRIALSFDFYINESKGIIVMIDPFNKKVIKKTAKGDKFDAYTGATLCLAEDVLGLKYHKVEKIVNTFTKTTKTNDPAIKMIQALVEEVVSLDRKQFEDLLTNNAQVSQDKDGQPIKHIRMTVQ